MAVAALIASSAPADSFRSRAHRPSPGHRCTIESQDAFRHINGDVEVHAAGNGSGMVHWETVRDFQAPGITAVWFGGVGRPFRLESGTIYISWFNPIPARQRPPRRMSVELRTDLETPPMVGNNRLATRRGRLEGLPVSLYLDWSTVVALARGTERLLLVTRGADNAIIHHAEIDRTIFSRAAAEIAPVLARMNEMMADPQRNCVFEEDLNHSDIIVT